MLEIYHHKVSEIWKLTADTQKDCFLEEGDLFCVASKDRVKLICREVSGRHMSTCLKEELPCNKLFQIEGIVLGIVSPCVQEEWSTGREPAQGHQRERRALGWLELNLSTSISVIFFLLLFPQHNFFFHCTAWGPSDTYMCTYFFSHYHAPS